MDDLVDEIALIAICFSFGILAGNGNFAIVGMLMSVALVSIRKFAREPLRLASQIVFYICAIFLSDVFFYIPVAAYISMHEKRWIERVLWVVPFFCVYVLGRVMPELVVGTSVVSLEVLVLEFILCVTATGLAVRNARQQIEREGYRYAYDELREDYLSCARRQSEAEVGDDIQSERFAGLTERELAIVRLVSEGMDNREIASQLFLSEGTVRNHISSILAKKDLSNRTQIAVLYYRGC